MSTSKSDFWMPIYIGDLLADTQHLTNEQFGQYHKLLYHQWRHGHFSEEEMFAISGFSGSIFEDPESSTSSTPQALLKQAASRLLAPIKQMLSKDDAGLWFSRRCDLEKTKWIEKKRVFVERARKGGIAKEKRRRENIEKSSALSSATSSAKAVLQDVLEECSSPKEQVQKQRPTPPTPPTARPLEGTEKPPSPLPGISGQVPAAAVPEASAVKHKSVNRAKPAKNGATARPDGPVKGNVQAAEENRVAVPYASIAPGANLGVRPIKPAGVKGELFEEVFRFWEAGSMEGYECPWTDLESRALDDLVRRNPGLDRPRFKQLLRNRAASEGINRADPPHKWLRSVVKYADGPLDRYNKPLKPARVH